MRPAPDLEILSWLEVGGLMGVGFPGNHLYTVPPIHKQEKPPTLRSLGEKAQVTLSYRMGSAFCLHLQRKESRFFKL